MTAYERGRRFEYRTKHDLDERGYYTVRAAGSHSKIDIAAFKGEVCLMIQCKTDGKLPKSECATLVGISTNPRFLPILASKTKAGKIQYHLLPGKESFDPGQSESSDKIERHREQR